MLAHKIYNGVTWFRHHVLRRPIRLAVSYDNKVKHPRLTVVFLHGISATSNTWLPTIRQISKDRDLSGIRLIALDLLGFGKSLHADWLDYDYLEYDQALDRALRKLHVSEPLVLVGHSMGALIAADYATNFAPSIPLRQLILVSPPVLMAAELARLPDQVYTRSYSSLHNFATTVPAADVIAKIIQRFSSFRSDYLKTVAFAKSMEQIILNSKNYQTFTRIHISTLIVHGHFDPLVLGTNLRRATNQNPRYLTYQSVIGQHDLSAGKRARIIRELKELVQNEVQN